MLPELAPYTTLGCGAGEHEPPEKTGAQQCQFLCDVPAEGKTQPVDLPGPSRPRSGTRLAGCRARSYRTAWAALRIRSVTAPGWDTIAA
jgi:hypothetical protein